MAYTHCARTVIQLPGAEPHHIIIDLPLVSQHGATPPDVWVYLKNPLMYLFAQAFKETLQYGFMQSTLSEFGAHFLYHFNQ